MIIGRRWTPSEDAVIRELYVSSGAVAVAAKTGRTVTAVCQRSIRIGVKRKLRWSEADDRRLRVMWGEKTTAEVAAALGRTPLTTYQRALMIGLPLGCPQGFEYLTDAARRAGFATESMRMILRWARVQLRPAMSRPVKFARVRPTHVVDPSDVDEAVEAWLKTETPAAAAERYGIVPQTMERYLEASGLELPPKPRGKRRWRIPTATIDAAMDLWASRESMRQAATRLGVPRGTLRCWAISSGIPRPAGKLWMVDRKAIEQLVNERRAA